MIFAHIHPTLPFKLQISPLRSSITLSTGFLVISCKTKPYPGVQVGDNTSGENLVYAENIVISGILDLIEAV